MSFLCSFLLFGCLQLLPLLWYLILSCCQLPAATAEVDLCHLPVACSKHQWFVPWCCHCFLVQLKYWQPVQSHHYWACKHYTDISRWYIYHSALLFLQEVRHLTGFKGLELVWNNGSGRGWISQTWTTIKASVPCGSKTRWLYQRNMLPWGLKS